MTNDEFINEFDIIYNNITSNKAPGLDDYEKSVFLNKAQDEFVKSYFNPRSNKTIEGFDSNEIRQIDFSNIIKTYSTTEVNANVVKVPDINRIMMILNEFVDITKGINSSGEPITDRLTIVSINYKELARLLTRPYKYPKKGQAWRIINSKEDGNKQFEIIVHPGETITKYSMRYVKNPQAIRLTDFEEGLTIDGSNTSQECELDPIIHHELIQRAAEMAKAAFSGDMTAPLVLGNSSQTNVTPITASK